uniref:TraE protein n=1 Tax=Clostridioides difficile TaxID=1496 RepID=A0A381I789_CLODI|nr:TraE protein [Clostridioides difficile]
MVVRNIIQTKFTRPKERPYRTENLYAVLEKQRKLEKEVSAIVKRTNKKDAEAAGNRRKLTRAEKKQIAEAIRKAKGDGKARTAQQTIPYLAMYPDGICKVTEKRYSKCVMFEDINYQLAQADDKTAIFENWCDFLNYFDASVSVQLSFINQGTQREQAEKAISIPAQEDAFNSIRTEYSDMLKNQLSKGNNGL